MARKKPRIATIDEVRITREKTTVIIEFIDGSVGSTHLELGKDVQGMSDVEIVDTFNQVVFAMEYSKAMNKYTPVEVPAGKPQIRYSKLCEQWVPRGDVLRCIISDTGPDHEAVVEIDDQELSMHEFGRLLATYAGWGMRIVFVQDDEIHINPKIVVEDPKDEGESNGEN